MSSITLPDAQYLREALRRAGRNLEVESVEVRELDEGRQSNKVFSIRAEPEGAFVLKTFPIPSWRDPIFGKGNGEVGLWRKGVTRNLPLPVHCPTIDVFHRTDLNEGWMLMDDVSSGIVARGIYDEERLQWLLRGLAAMHAHYWDNSSVLATFPLITLETHCTYLAEPILALGGRRKVEGWIKDAIEQVTVLKPLVPLFLEVLGSDADFYLNLAEHRKDWVDILAQSPQTLTHGDIRRANVALLARDHVSLFDWDMASRAPAATDLTWFWFLHFWAYPPKESPGPAGLESLKEYYVNELKKRVGARFDRKDFERSWELGWLKAFMQLGFCLVDPLVGKHDAAALESVRTRVQLAITEAKRIHLKHLS